MGRTGTTPPPITTAKPRRPWRENLEAFGVAILMAVLLKPMIIEAYQIPTPSMQPTLMGSPVAGVHDRILVDKLRYEIFEPQRWDIVVFRYPIRRNQNYVKRIVGVPGDRLRIIGGNLHTVDQDGNIDGVVRKPDRIQAGLWKQIYPARREVEEGTRVLGDYFEGRAGEWREDGEALVVSPSSRGRSRLAFVDRDHGGITNLIWDGYPLDVARAIREDAGSRQTHGVQDVRFSFEITPSAELEGITVEVALAPAGKTPLELALVADGGQGRLVVRVGDEERAASEPFACTVPAGETTSFGLMHLDDRVVAWRDGDELGSLEVGDARLATLLDGRGVQVSVETRGGGEQRFAELTLDRDLHYVDQGLEDALHELVPEGMDPVIQNHVIEVPAGHYFMMGDNTLASADSRQWKVFTIGMTEDGRMVDPATNPDARVANGNRRPWPLSVKPDNDENPVILRSGNDATPDQIAFTDDDGEVFRLTGKISHAHNEEEMKFVDLGGTTPHQWTPEERHVYFVPREHILGRPLTAFWPLGRIGFIR